MLEFYEVTEKLADVTLASLKLKKLNIVSKTYFESLVATVRMSFHLKTILKENLRTPKC
jgi:hypothetical protein